ncbi:MAG: hypothetical protein Q8R60_16770 [Mycobacteriales bacterium]|nr:hypothetical protein [Mycobacteriales bacterium]
MILAHHPLVTALPLVIPAVVMALLLVGIVVRDRRTHPSDEG